MRGMHGPVKNVHRLTLVSTLCDFLCSKLTKNIGCGEGDTVSLMDVREQYADEYATLTPAEKEAIVVQYESKKVQSAPSTRVTARSRVQDFAHTYQQISDLVCLLLDTYQMSNNC